MSLRHAWPVGRSIFACAPAGAMRLRCRSSVSVQAAFPENESNYRMKQAYAGGEFVARPIRWSKFTGGVTFEDYTLEQGTGSSPSIEAIHTPDSAPGLGLDPAYLHASTSAGLDWRPGCRLRAKRRTVRNCLPSLCQHGRHLQLRPARRGGRAARSDPSRELGAVVSRPAANHARRRGPGAVFPAAVARQRQHAARLFAAGAFATGTACSSRENGAGFRTGLALDMALFYDAGKVAPTLRRISLDGLNSNFGIGARFHGPARTPLRVELARGREGTHLVFAASAAF